MHNPSPESVTEFQFTNKTGGGGEVEERSMIDENSNNAITPGNMSL